MGQQHQRKKRRRRYQKVDIPIASLAAITIILLFVWGGLYWRESTEKALMNHAVNEEPLAIGEISDSSSGIVSDPGVVRDMSPLPEESQSTVEMNTNTDGTTPIDSGQLIPAKVEGQSVTPSTPQSTKNSDVKSPANTSQQRPTNSTTQNSSSVNSAQQEPTNSKTTSSANSVTPSSVTPSSVTPSSATEGSTNASTKSPINSDVPTPTQNITSSPVLVEPVVDPAQKYGQEIQKIQSMCSSDKNAVLNDAEKSIQQLDMRNPTEIQNWRDNLTAKLVAAESTCEGAFQEQIRLAENDFVSDEVIDGWRNTYTALKLRLKEESEAKIQGLMGGG